MSASSEKAGNAVITVAAVDGSKKKVSVKAALLVPVTELTIGGKGGLTTVTPGKTLIMQATTNKDASNKNVVWDFANEAEAEKAGVLGIDLDKFRRTGQVFMKKGSTGNGTFSVIARPKDGSNVERQAEIVAKPKAVTKISILEGETAVKKTTLGIYRVESDKTRTDAFRISRVYDLSMESAGAKGSDFQKVPTVVSSNENIVKAKINDEGRLCVYTYDDLERCNRTGTATVTVKAADGSAKSATLQVKVAEPVREILVSADKPTRKIGANGKLKMKATVDQRATNKKVSWKLYNMGGHEIKASDQIATVSASGELKPYAKLAERTEVQVYAVATDGTPTSSKPEKISLYPAQGAITFSKIKEGEDPEVISRLEIDADGYADVKITGVEKSLMDYQVTYRTGPVSVAYVTVSDDGTQICIRGLKPGTSTITATARDGSGKKAVLKVTVK